MFEIFPCTSDCWPCQLNDCWDVYLDPTEKPATCSEPTECGAQGCTTCGIVYNKCREFFAPSPSSPTTDSPSSRTTGDGTCNEDGYRNAFIFVTVLLVLLIIVGVFLLFYFRCCGKKAQGGQSSEVTAGGQPQAGVEAQPLNVWSEGRHDSW